ncbi:BlaI/MecI/CopY family transcriptional regulator [Pygmaiobacter massiliensis]|uniref:BlaI/MecI/CopY family transcriptional regulator n=1 Tax=Pygmaiobacter massiliensis TaxID=1917873 RepID=UPI0028A1A317|nr:BlaI/MecI/CopY family transcriptional regulator [Pygmaiobacter massiliensis]
MDILIFNEGDDCIFTKGELAILALLWKENRELTKNEMIGLIQDKSFKPNTIYFILNGLLEKGAIQVAGIKLDGTSHYARAYTAVLTQEEYAASHIKHVLPRINLAGIVSALAGKEPVSPDTLDELRNLIDEMERNAKAVEE